MVGSVVHSPVVWSMMWSSPVPGQLMFFWKMVFILLFCVLMKFVLMFFMCLQILSFRFVLALEWRVSMHIMIFQFVGRFCGSSSVRCWSVWSMYFDEQNADSVSAIAATDWFV